MGKKYKSLWGPGEKDKIVPTVVGAKYSDWDGYHASLGFVPSNAVIDLSCVIRSAMFGQKYDQNTGRIMIKRFKDMTGIEYGMYTKCFEEIVGILHSYSGIGEVNG